MTNNPCGLNGFAFIEFSGLNQAILETQFKIMGFTASRQHITENITCFRQGNIEFILNLSKGGQAEQHAKTHGPGACAMGFMTHNAKTAFQYAIANGAEAFHEIDTLNSGLFAIKAIGGSIIYFVDEQTAPFQGLWKPLKHGETEQPGLYAIDHLTHNVHQGNMDKWAQFYERIFNFKEIRYFDIKGQFTGLVSRALASPCGKIKIPLNESKDSQSQIEEFLQDYHGEGIQHIALNTHDIYSTVHQLRLNGVRFLDVPDTYYEMIQSRVPWHHEPIKRLQQEKILIDGDKNSTKGLLLQIFTENVFGPVFFEIIQRKGNEGFGEGNFQALFEAIERDQIRRGTLRGHTS